MSHSLTLVILLDAFRWDYLNETDTPYLHSLKKDSLYIEKQVNTGGFCERSVFMTGANPETTDNYFAFAYRPVGYRRPAHEPKFNVPLLVRTHLVMTEDETADFTPGSFKNWSTGETIESIWDVMRKKKKTFAVEACVGLGIQQYKGKTTHGARPIQLVNKLKQEKPDLAYIQFSETDQEIHYSGVENRAKTLNYVDAQVEWLHSEAKKLYEDVKLLVFGDHGMDSIKKRVDFPLEYPYQPGYDYIYLKSSTAIQFWCPETRVRKHIYADPLLNAYGTFIEPPTERQGDIIWRANYGTLVSPCHFHAANDPIRAMHGWDEQNDGMRGMAMIYGVSRGVKANGCLNDICPTICDLVGIPYPKHNKGVSYVKD